MGITYSEAENILIEKLKEKGIKFTDGYRITGENFKIDFRGKGYLHHDYEKINITISTLGYSSQYPHSIKKYLRNFDIINGDYDKIIEKINFIISENKKMEKLLQKNEKLGKENFTKSLLKFKKYNPKMSEYVNGFEIRTNNLVVTICPDSDENIEISFKGNYEDLIKLLDKIKE